METVALHPAKPKTAQDSSGDGSQVLANTIIIQKVKNPRPDPPPKRRSAPGKHQQTQDAACLPAPSRAQKAPTLRLPRNRRCRASPLLISCIRHILVPSCALRRILHRNVGSWQCALLGGDLLATRHTDLGPLVRQWCSAGCCAVATTASDGRHVTCCLVLKRSGKLLIDGIGILPARSAASQPMCCQPAALNGPAPRARLLSPLPPPRHPAAAPIPEQILAQGNGWGEVQ